MALAGRFTEHHALLCGLHRDRIKVFDDAVAGLDERITGKAARWQRELELLKTIPGFGELCRPKAVLTCEDSHVTRILWTATQEHSTEP